MLSKINNKKLALQYLPAREIDRDLIRDLKNKNASSLPAYLIRSIPTLSLDSEVLAVGMSTQFGSKQIATVTMSAPWVSSPNAMEYKITAGDETVFVSDVAGVNQDTIDRRFKKTPSNTASENLQSVGNMFWMLNNLGSQFAATENGVAWFRLPSVGVFGAPLLTRYFFGIPKSGSYLGRYADVKLVSLAAINYDGSQPVEYLRQIGIHGSDFEGLAFDATFNRPVGAAGSTSRYLARSLKNGDAVLRITRENQAVLQTLDIPVDVKFDIQNSLDIGKEAFVSSKELEIGEWRGLGYILFDPENGSGAYLISGGYNGGNDTPPCGSASAVTAPAQATERPSFSNAELLCFAIMAILCAALIIEYAIGAAIVGVVLMAVGTANAATPPNSGLTASQESIWSKTFGGGRPFPTTYPGSDIRVCSKEVFKELYSAQNRLCRVPSKCDGRECAAAAQEKMRNAQACISKRLEVMNECFSGGDETHWLQVRDRVKGMATCSDCLANQNSQCTP